MQGCRQEETEDIFEKYAEELGSYKEMPPEERCATIAVWDSFFRDLIGKPLIEILKEKEAAADKRLAWKKGIKPTGAQEAVKEYLAELDGYRTLRYNSQAYYGLTVDKDDPFSEEQLTAMVKALTENLREKQERMRTAIAEAEAERDGTLEASAGEEKKDMEEGAER